MAVLNKNVAFYKTLQSHKRRKQLETMHRHSDMQNKRFKFQMLVPA